MLDRPSSQRVTAVASTRPERQPDGLSIRRKLSQDEISMMATTNGFLRKFIGDEEGAALAEYGILVAFIAIVAIVAVTFFGSKISAKFSQYANSLS